MPSHPTPSANRGLLTVRLDAIVRNWRRIAAEVGERCRTAAVVKADAYGLGADPVARALDAAGCDLFFVATFDEAVRLRHSVTGDIAVLNGLPPGCGPVFARHRLIPVLNDLAEAAEWAGCVGKNRPAMLQLDTGMSRLGLEIGALDQLPLPELDLACVMSHLACADQPAHEMNARQLGLFRTMLARLGTQPASLAASSGVFLGRDHHFDLVRPGAALYGINPVPGRASPVERVIRLQAPILQTREIDRGQAVGYGATFVAPRRSRVSTVAVGYADGFLRAAGNRSRATIAEFAAPVIGPISMDLLTLDVTDVPPLLCRPGALVDLLTDCYGPDELARDSGTIGYEILTSLGRRYERAYRDFSPAEAVARGDEVACR